MRQLIVGLVSVFYSLHTYGQTEINSNLKRELDSIYSEDQKYRELLFSGILKTKADSVAESYSISTDQLSNYLMNSMIKADSSNSERIERILNQYGYPGKKLVGVPTNEAAFYVIQHSQKIDKYLPVVKKAAEQKELPFRLYALMLDRSRMNQGKEQIYGTQARSFEAFNPQTGKKEFKMIIWPIQNASTVNRRRKKAGFDQTVEENAKRLGTNYTPLTLEEVKKMQGK